MPPDCSTFIPLQFRGSCSAKSHSQLNRNATRLHLVFSPGVFFQTRWNIHVFMQNVDNPEASRGKLPKKDVVVLVPNKIHTDQGVI